VTLVVQIASEFTGKKAFKDAEKATGGLDESAKKLGKALAAAFATDKIIDFAKASAKAFMEDQKSAAMLANTLKNLSLEFAAPQMETFIQGLSRSAAVADEVLRPAMQKLLTTTGDYFKSQELLTQAIEISRGSGVDLATVAQDLASAYVGNTKGLKKYNLGLTQAQLKTMSFTDVQKKLTDQFKGSNAAYLKTYAGQMEVLKTAAGEAQETIGKGLVDAITILAGEDVSVQQIADAFQSLADNVANTAVGIATLSKSLKTIPGLNSVMNNLKWWAEHGGLGIVGSTITGTGLAAVGAKETNKKLQNPSVQMFMTDQNNQRLAKEQSKTQKEQVKQTKALTAEQKKQAALKKAGTIFDIEQINLIAALKGNLSDEERKRVLLQLALLTDNDTMAKKLTAEIATANGLTAKLAGDLSSLKPAANPFEAWSSYLDGIIAKVKMATGDIPVTNTPPATNVPRGAGGYIPSNYGVGAGGSTLGTAALTASRTDSAASIVIQIDGKTIATAVQDQALNGNQSTINRAFGSFAE
jgi:hypothetical protein